MLVNFRWHCHGANRNRLRSHSNLYFLSRSMFTRQDISYYHFLSVARNRYESFTKWIAYVIGGDARSRSSQMTRTIANQKSSPSQNGARIFLSWLFSNHFYFFFSIFFVQYKLQNWSSFIVICWQRASTIDMLKINVWITHSSNAPGGNHCQP